MVRCDVCGLSFEEQDLHWRCTCGGYLDLINWSFTFEPNPSLPGIWRYASALPIEDMTGVISMGEGMTPLIRKEWSVGGGGGFAVLQV